MLEVLERFDFGNTIAKLDEAGLLFLVLERFASVDLHPDAVSNHEMGSLFEELIRRFNEALNENPGEHFTPHEVIDLMVTLMLAGTEDELGQPHIVRTVYDPCAGSGGMLTIAKDRIREINPNADVFLFGQEVNPETWAVAKADLLITGRMDSYGFEQLVATVPRSLGASEVRIVPRSLDKGADIVATFSLAETFHIRLAVQAKHFRPDPPVGAHIIDQLVAGMEAEQTGLGWVARSGSFAPEAEKRKQEIEEQRGIQIELVDGDQLAAMIVEGGLRAVGFSDSSA